MATRPIFIPTPDGIRPSREALIEFRWHSGLAATQKTKSINELHTSAKKYGMNKILEVSRRSDKSFGVDLSAFNLMFRVDGLRTTVECIFQGSKVFEHGGPYTEMYKMTSKEAKSDNRLRTSGRLTGFEYEGRAYQIFPKTSFYDWIYINALWESKEKWFEILSKFDGFSDIEFNPEKSINCQARSCAIFVGLVYKKIIDDCVESFDYFVEMTY